MYLDSFSSWSLGLSFVTNRQCFLLTTTFELLFTYFISTGNKKQCLPRGYKIQQSFKWCCTVTWFGMKVFSDKVSVLWLVVYCVQVFIIILEEFTTSTIKLIQWSLPLGHLDSRDSSTQGMQKLVLDRCLINPCISSVKYLYWRDTSIQRKGTLFLDPKT